MKKILIINTVPFIMGGMSATISNYLRYMDKQDMDITLIVNSQIEEHYRNQFLREGIKLIVLERNKKILNYMIAIFKLMKKEKFDLVHIHGNSATMAFETIPALLARVKKRIVHCHNTFCDHQIINKVLLPIFKRTYTLAIACSNAAGQWLFKDNKEFNVLNNGIDLEKYMFNHYLRKEVRDELDITNEYVIGHIGLFNEQKNHEKIFQVVSCLKKSINVKLVCVSGDKSIPKEIKEMIEKYDLKENVKILLRRTDANRILQAFDFFIFPSKFEGFGIAFIEAQASGLYCLASNNVPTSAGICKNLVNYMSLEKKEDEWANLILHCKNSKSNERELLSENAVNDLRNAGYDTVQEANKLRKVYMS